MRCSRGISLYVHIPFCETKCPYCDFNTYAGIEPLMSAYVAALESEIGLWGRMLGGPRVRTVFFGGGTPSYLPSGDIGRLMEAIGSAFRVDLDAEVTLEANPGDFGDEKLAAYLGCGVNRLSIGVQSFDDGLLRMLGRRHGSLDAVDACRQAVAAGFENISVDLMYGLPYQSMEQWGRTLGRTLELGLPHVSMYCLTLEGGTPMERWVDDGRMPEPDADLAADMYLMAQEEMGRAGYRHYEISNWALRGKRSRHNLTYWRNEPYLGVGPGAHSYLGGLRFSSVRSPREYIRRMREAGADGGSGSMRSKIGAVPVVDDDDIEVIDASLEMAETMMLGLRLDAGVRRDRFAERFGAAPSEFYAGVLDELEGLGLLREVDGSIRLTERGRMMGNEVFSRFFA